MANLSELYLKHRPSGADEALRKAAEAAFRRIARQNTVRESAGAPASVHRQFGIELAIETVVNAFF